MSRVPHLLSFLLLLSAVTAGRSEPARADAIKDIAPKLVSIQQKDQPLSKALEAFQAKTGVAVLPPTGEDPRITLDLKDVAFWPALDAIAQAADMHVYPYLRDGKLGLLRGRRDVPVSYSGPFRITIKRIVVARDTEADAGTTRATLEIVWPPPFEAFLLESQPHGLVVQDDKGTELPLPLTGKSYTDAFGKNAVELEVKLPSVPRTVPRLGQVKGSVLLVGAAKMLTFSFDLSRQLKPQTKDGVTVELSEVKTIKEPWVFKVRTKAPSSGPQFDSHLAQSCLRGNQAVLLNLLKRDLRVRPRGTEAVESPANESLIVFRFGEDDDVKLKQPSDWSLDYRAPSPLLEIAIPFEFRDVPLP